MSIDIIFSYVPIALMKCVPKSNNSKTPRYMYVLPILIRTPHYLRSIVDHFFCCGYVMQGMYLWDNLIDPEKVYRFELELEVQYD